MVSLRFGAALSQHSSCQHVEEGGALQSCPIHRYSCLRNAAASAMLAPKPRSFAALTLSPLPVQYEYKPVVKMCDMDDGMMMSVPVIIL